MKAPVKALRQAYTGQDVWVIKYPSVTPCRARVINNSGHVAVVAPYDSLALRMDQKYVLNFEAGMGEASCYAFENESDAVEAWNAIVYEAIAEATHVFKDHMAMLDARIIPVEGAGEEKKG